MTDPQVLQETVRNALFGEPELKSYALLDGAAIPDLLERLASHDQESICLYRGEMEDDLRRAAPYLVQLNAKSPLVDWLIEEGWGQNWGIYALAEERFTPLRQHFRKFLMVRGPENEPLYFRYYDPRVLRTYLPTCQAPELNILFGPVRKYILPSPEGKVLVAEMKDGQCVLR